MKRVLVIGGAGFIGTHVARRYLADGQQVFVADNYSRRGSKLIQAMLKEYATSTPGQLRCEFLDIRNREAVEALIGSVRPDLIVHQAAQVAVTRSVVDPRLDFEINAMGTFNILEACRKFSPDSFLIYSSTNKVYGSMEDVVVVEELTRYRYRDYPEGLDEHCNLDFHSPYACSKGAADQYVHDYYRMYGLRTAVFRQSCIYGTHQLGVEDQGWIAWFTIAQVLGKSVTIYGSGKQVRDVLWIDDLVEAYDRAWKRDKAGSVYNMGGGSQNSLSLIELMAILQELHPSQLKLGFDRIRPGDQPVYIANAEKAKRELDWAPQVDPRDGIARLVTWVRDNQAMISKALAV